MNFQEFKSKYEKVPVEHYPHKVSQRPIVSVCVQTYQHEKYIKECLDGILMQNVDFDYEILLGEDNSKDRTREICIEYAIRFPDKIRLFLHDRANNIAINGTPTGRFNMMYNLFEARGKYIALCEGDDYWTDPQKLQKQIDFLETNQEFSICFHKVKILENGVLEDDYITKVPSTVTTIKDLARGNYIHTPSCVFRNRIEETIGEHIYESAIGDYYLHMMNAQYGDIFYMDEEMAIYRVHGGSYWSSMKHEIQLLGTAISQRAILLDFLDKTSNGYKVFFQSYVDHLFKLYFLHNDQEWKSEVLKNTNKLSQPFAKYLIEKLKKINTLEIEKKSIKKAFKNLVRLIIKRITK